MRLSQALTQRLQPTRHTTAPAHGSQPRPSQGSDNRMYVIDDNGAPVYGVTTQNASASRRCETPDSSEFGRAPEARTKHHDGPSGRTYCILDDGSRHYFYGRENGTSAPTGFMAELNRALTDHGAFDSLSFPPSTDSIPTVTARPPGLPTPLTAFQNPLPDPPPSYSNVPLPVEPPPPYEPQSAAPPPYEPQSAVHR